MRQLAALLLALAVLVSACAARATDDGAGAVKVLDGFDGTEMAGGRPPDAGIAAGRSSLLLVTNAFVSLRSKSGDSEASATLRGFFAPVTPAGETVMDPRAVYDPSSDRFFVSALSVKVPYQDCQPPLCTSHVLLAASRAGRPPSLGTTDWRLALMPAADPPLVADQPSLAVAGDVLVLTINLVRAQKGSLARAGQDLRLLSKASLLQDGQPPVWKDLGETAASLQPVMAFSAVDRPFFAGIVPGDCSWVVAAVDDPLGRPSLRSEYLPSTAHCATPLAAGQPAGPPLGPDRLGPESRPTSRDGFIWLAHPTADGPSSVIHWAEIDVRRWPEVSLVQEGLLEDSPAALYEPVALAGPGGDMALFFARLSATEKEALVYAWRPASDPPGTLRAEQVVKRSTGVQPVLAEDMHSGRFGDYFDGAFDPLDGSAWFYGEYFPGNITWGMWVLHVGWGGGGTAAG